ncbi:MAG: phosphonate metabolism transcriptional regulator PhnF, partial [Pseudomonadota bacterium]
MNQSDELERRAGVALWLQIKEQLQSQILSGTIRPGTRLPPEPDLADQFGVNRHTVRRAIRALSDDGLVRAEQGRGTFVQEHGIDYLIGARTRFSENITRAHRDPRAELLASRDAPPDEVVAIGLGMAKSDLCLVMETRHFADGAPLSIATNYFPRSRFPDLEHHFLEHHSITAALRAVGIADYLRHVSRITARMPDEREAGHLRQAI